MAPNLNVFTQAVQLGQLDLRFNPSTIECEIHSSEGGTLVAGQAVKLYDSTGGVPKVVATSADADVVFGYVTYDAKATGYIAGSAVSISIAHNVIYLRAGAAIARGAFVKAVNAVTGKVITATAGARVVGYALDKAAADADLIRVWLLCPMAASNGVGGFSTLQMPLQADTVAADLAALKVDFNLLLGKLKTAGLMASA